MERNPLLIIVLCIGGAVMADAKPPVAKKKPRAQVAITSTPGKALPNITINFFAYNPPGAVNGQGILKETLSRCPQYGLAQIGSFDKATKCHECTHFICGELNNERKQSRGGLYVGNGQALVLREPRALVSEITNQVPAHLRNGKGHTFRDYMSKRGDRNALFILEEWTCYTNDSQCTVEERLEPDGGLDRASEFGQYAEILVQHLKAREPDYPDLAQLEAFVQWQQARLRTIQNQQPQRAHEYQLIRHQAPLDAAR